MFTAVEKKEMELDKLKLATNKHMARLNGLKRRYMDWFDRKQNSFLDSLKLIHILGGSLLPKHINTISHYRRVRDLSKRFPRNGTPRDSSPVKMDEFIAFWEEFYFLKLENDTIYEKVCDFCNSVGVLRDQSVKDEIDRLHFRVNLFCSEDFNFQHLHNERDNLFTYRVSPQDHLFQGLINFVPFLLGYTSRLCYWVGKLFIEAL